MVFVPIVAAAAGGLAAAAANKFFSGSGEKHKQIPTLSKEQIPLRNQAINAGLRPGAGGAFGSAADYYRNNLSDNPQDFQAFAQPEMRRYNEQTIPDLAEQFAGMGAGNLSSSGFRNAAVSAGTDLSERLAQIRANLRQQSAQGLLNVGQAGLGNYSADRMTQASSPGFASEAAPALAKAGVSAVSDWWNRPNTSQNTPKVGQNTSPYGGSGAAYAGGSQINSSPNNNSPPNFNNTVRV